MGGHEGVGRVVKFGPNVSPTDKLQLGTLVGIRFLSRVCHECEYCVSGRDQHCGNATNHLHHEDGSFQEYCLLDTKFLTELPQDIDPKVVGPALCAGVTTYKVLRLPMSCARTVLICKAVKNANIKEGEYLTVIGAVSLSHSLEDVSVSCSSFAEQMLMHNFQGGGLGHFAGGCFMMHGGTS